MEGVKPKRKHKKKPKETASRSAEGNEPIEDLKGL